MSNTADRRPRNAIWIFGDQHPAHALSCHGNPNLNTPNLDRLAGNGLDFVNAVGGFPLCCPFRGSLLTSRYPHDCVPGHEYPMPIELPTIADAFNSEGYETDCLTDILVEYILDKGGLPADKRDGFFAVLSVQPPTIRTWLRRRGWSTTILQNCGCGQTFL